MGSKKQYYYRGTNGYGGCINGNGYGNYGRSICYATTAWHNFTISVGLKDKLTLIYTQYLCIARYFVPAFFCHQCITHIYHGKRICEPHQFQENVLYNMSSIRCQAGYYARRLQMLFPGYCM